jgi:hypothetical protein
MSLLSRLRSDVLQRRSMVVAIALGLSCISSNLMAQDTPLISGGLGFLTTTTGGKTSYLPVIMPVLAAPVGPHLLFESRANFVEDFSPKAGGGYNTRHSIGPSFIQADYIVTPHLTVVGGYFLIPFGTYNERLTPIWINNFQDGPLIYGLGNFGSGSGTGGMVRGNAWSTGNVSISYAAYMSAGSTNEQIVSSRSTGGQVSVYLPKARLEVGTSYGRLLEKTQVNAVGTHVWWEPASIPLQIRSEYAHGPHSQGYWVEAAYRLSAFHGSESPVGRLEPVFKLQQTFRNSPDPTDGLPSADTVQPEFGLDYHLPHEVRINTSYSRMFSATGNVNIWETELVYRFLFPAWKGKK